MPLVLFAVANPSIPPFFQMLGVCYSEVMYMNAVSALVEAQLEVEYVKKHYTLDQIMLVYDFVLICQAWQ
jgi:hypothetical protein